jgi:hypothetical protein
MHDTKKKRDWSQYTAAAKKSGEVTFYISREAIVQWENDTLTGERGASNTYSDIAIETCLALRAVYDLSLRKTNGFVYSILQMMQLKLLCPDYTTLCRRSQALKITFERPVTKEPIVVAIDSTGIKVYGEGEWKVRQHGAGKRRTWLKLHLAVNVHNHHIEAFEVTQNNVADCAIAPQMLHNIKAPVDAFSGDGAYDATVVYQVAEDIGARPIVPPRRDATLQKLKSSISAKNPRDAAITYIQQHGNNDSARKLWKIDSSYHARSIAETAVYRFKSHFRPSVRARIFANQNTEIAIKVKTLNKIAALGTFPLKRAASLNSP